MKSIFSFCLKKGEVYFFLNVVNSVIGIVMGL